MKISSIPSHHPIGNDVLTKLMKRDRIQSTEVINVWSDGGYLYIAHDGLPIRNSLVDIHKVTHTIGGGFYFEVSWFMEPTGAKMLYLRYDGKTLGIASERNVDDKALFLQAFIEQSPKLDRWIVLVKGTAQMYEDIRKSVRINDISLVEDQGEWRLEGDNTWQEPA